MFPQKDLSGKIKEHLAGLVWKELNREMNDESLQLSRSLITASGVLGESGRVHHVLSCTRHESNMISSQKKDGRQLDK